MKVKYTDVNTVSVDGRFILWNFTNALEGEAEELDPIYTDRELAKIATLQRCGIFCSHLYKRACYIIDGKIYTAYQVQVL